MPPTRVDDISDLPVNFLRCRDIGHTWWDPRKRTEEVTPHGRYVERANQCASCGSSKIQLFTPGGKPVTGARYSYVDGYLLTKGKQQAIRYDARRIALRAAMNGRRS